uniref:FAD-binding domain-containing protein n=1 Tax=Bionectria ochroleuca TaxID=29856 RepID=A0A8H7TQM5_BIOOC
MGSNVEPAPIEIAIVGGGPGGLGTAIALSKLPFVHVTLYEQNSEPREAGAGLSLSTNAWKVLDILGAGQLVKGGSKKNTHQRNAFTGKILHVTRFPENSDADNRGSVRARRVRLQSALLSQVPKGIIQFSKKLISLENLDNGKVRLQFKDGTETVVDLLVGADGIRSITRRTLFPDHPLKFTGDTQWRTLVPRSSLDHLPDVTHATGWWWGETGHVYFSDVDDLSETSDPYFEITVRSYHEPHVPGETVVWGVPATNEKVASRVEKFDQRIRDAVAVVVLIGDASHPLSGAFGSGATFAMEDGWILAQALQYTKGSPHQIRDALEIFEQIRAPYYEKMYVHLDEVKVNLQQAQAKVSTLDEKLQLKIDHFLLGDKDFIYKNDIGKVWEGYVSKKQAQISV